MKHIATLGSDRYPECAQPPSSVAHRSALEDLTAHSRQSLYGRATRLSPRRRFAYAEVFDLLARVVIGPLFLYAGLVKALDPAAAVLAIRGYDLLPVFLLQPAALGFAWLEIALGALLLLGLWTRFAAAGIGILSVVFLVVLVQAKVRGLSISCGCFGGDGSGAGVTWLDLLREPPLLAAALFLAGRNGRWRLDRLLEGGRGVKRWIQARRLGPIVLVAVILIASFAVPGLPGGTGVAAARNGEVSTSGAARDTLLPTGSRIPDFSAPALGGGTVSWWQYRGVPTVLIVWAPWCPNCREELPLLGRLADEYPTVQLVGIVTAVDDASITPEDFMQSHRLDFPVALDSKDERLADALGVERFPTVYYVKADGSVLQVATGAAPETVIRSLMEAVTAG